MAFYRRWVLVQKSCRICVIVTIFICLVLGYGLIKKHKSTNFIEVATTTQPTNKIIEQAKVIRDNEIISANGAFTDNKLHVKLLQQKIERLEKRIKKSRSILFNSKTFTPNYKVHIFYYAWYANKEVDGYYNHWNHSYLPNWKSGLQRIYPTGSHVPTLDIGSNFYPALGCYSSKDPEVIQTHMRQLKEAGIGVIILSWTPPGFNDSPNEILLLLFYYADIYKIKIALHVEPYKDRNPINLFKYLKEFLKDYIKHPALYKMKKPSEQMEVPVVYIYDSYLTPAITWRELLSPKGNLSVRGSDVDAIFIGLLVDFQHR